jgi:hypothetical protein
VELVSSKALPDPRGARRALAAEEPGTNPDFAELTKGSATDHSGVTWDSYSDDLERIPGESEASTSRPPFSRFELGYRGAALVGLRWSYGD